MHLQRHGYLYELRKNKVLFLMILPAVLFFIIFSYLPLAGLVIAFKSFNYKQGIFLSPWNGFENFRYFFVSGAAWKISLNTVLYNTIFILTNTIVAGMSVAIIINEIKSRYYKKVCQSIILFPYFISWVVVAAMVYNLFNYDLGFVSNIFKSIGLEPPDIFNKGEYWYFLLPVINIWKYVGHTSIIYLAAITGINNELFEAAIVDGASGFQKVWYITIPLLKPTAVILTLLALGNILRGNFDMFYQLVGQNGLLHEKTDVIDTFVFRSLTHSPDFGMISASTFYQSVLCFLIIIVVNTFIRRVDSEYALY